MSSGTACERFSTHRLTNQAKPQDSTYSANPCRKCHRGQSRSRCGAPRRACPNTANLRGSALCSASFHRQGCLCHSGLCSQRPAPVLKQASSPRVAQASCLWKGTSSALRGASAAALLRRSIALKLASPGHARRGCLPDGLAICTLDTLRLYWVTLYPRLCKQLPSSSAVFAEIRHLFWHRHCISRVLNGQRPDPMADSWLRWPAGKLESSESLSTRSAPGRSVREVPN